MPQYETFAKAEMIVEIGLQSDHIGLQPMPAWLEFGAGGQGPVFTLRRRPVYAEKSVEYRQPEQRQEQTNQDNVGSARQSGSGGGTVHAVQKRK